MSIVSQCLRLVGIAVGGIMHQRLLGALHTQRFEECASHVMQFDDWDTLASCHPTHSIRVVGMGFLNLARCIETAPLGRSKEDDVCIACTHLIDKGLELGSEIVVGALAWAALLLVVMAKLHEDIVSCSQMGKNLLQSSGSNEGGGALATLGVVGYADRLVEPAGNHLPPRSPRLIVLVNNGTVTTEIERCDGLFGWLYLQHGQLRRRAVYLYRQTIVPVELVLFARLDADIIVPANEGGALVDGEGERLLLALLRRDAFQ